MSFKYNIFGTDQSSMRKILFYPSLIYGSFFNSLDYSTEYKMTAQLKNTEFEMLPKYVLMTQSEVSL
jgi:hypothetical protein